MNLLKWGSDLFYINLSIIAAVTFILNNILPNHNKYYLKDGKLRNEIVKLATKMEFPFS